MTIQERKQLEKFKRNNRRTNKKDGSAYSIPPYENEDKRN
jgi:hypothetical protein